MFGLKKSSSVKTAQGVSATPNTQSLQEQIAQSLPELRSGYVWNISKNPYKDSNAKNRYVLYLVKINRFIPIYPNLISHSFNDMKPSHVAAIANVILQQYPKYKPAQKIDTTDREAFGFYASTKLVHESIKGSK